MRALRLSSLPALLLVLMIGGCVDTTYDGIELSQAAARGRDVFRAQCAACHNYRDPFEPGSQGPALARATVELLAAKVLRGEYPAGHEPKRPITGKMPVQPMLKDRIADLAAFLAEVPAPAPAPAADGNTPR